MLQIEARQSTIRMMAKRHTSMYVSSETIEDLDYLAAKWRTSRAAAMEQAVAEIAGKARHDAAMRALAVARRAAPAEPPPAAPAPKKRRA